MAALAAGLVAAVMGQTPASATTAGNGHPAGLTAPVTAAAQYMYDEAHTGYQPNTTITAGNASSLHPVVSLNPDGQNTKLDSIFAQPIAYHGRVLVGDWDGYEYAFTQAGHVQWRTYLGRTVAPNQPTGCMPPKAGVSSTPAIARLRVHGRMTDVMFVGGGGPQDPAQPQGPVYFYALNARTGQILWRHQIGVAPSSSCGAHPPTTPAASTSASPPSATAPRSAVTL